MSASFASARMKSFALDGLARMRAIFSSSERFVRIGEAIAVSFNVHEQDIGSLYF
jgi:hypothetical protein